jgi:UDP-N-acetylglucosamine diphosphorylase/glucosamine-1-phosphate N-acetyltransferase
MAEMVVLFEDTGYTRLSPLTLSRPAFEIRCGVWTLRERIVALTGVAPGAICRPHLAAVYGTGRWPLRLLSNGAPVILVNGRALDLGWLTTLREETTDTVYVANEQGQPMLLGARLSPALMSSVLRDLLEQRAADALLELQRFVRVVEVETKLLAFPWDLIVCNPEQLTRDIELLGATQRWPSLAEQPRDVPHMVVHNPAHVFLHPQARLDGSLVLDARDGPIWIDAARIEPFSLIQGPAAVGPNALISSARLRPGTTIGPVCRIGGEIECSIVQAYTNKHHEGFLGHSYLGEWVNIGAMTTNSDLKNTYGSIKMTIEGLGQVDSGQIKLGCFLGDHVKLGIGMHLSGGSLIGTGSNLFGTHSLPKNVPPFTWGGEVFREYDIERMIGVARKVMSRRKIALSPAQEAMLRDVFVMTAGSRVGLFDAQTLATVEEVA